MRSWKKQQNKIKRIFLYFRAHPYKVFTFEHIAAQTKVAKVQTLQIIRELEAAGKLEGIDTVSSKWWGKPRRMWRAMRGGDDSLHQIEAFQHRQAVRVVPEDPPPHQATI